MRLAVRRLRVCERPRSRGSAARRGLLDLVCTGVAPDSQEPRRVLPPARHVAQENLISVRFWLCAWLGLGAAAGQEMFRHAAFAVPGIAVRAQAVPPVTVLQVAL